jgi:hypothetical protein
MLALGPPAATGCSGIQPTAASACLIDWVLANATVVATPKSGYYFALAAFPAAPNTSYVVGGAPSTAKTTGVRGFCSNEEGLIRYVAAAAAPVATEAACVAYTPLQ